METNGSFAEVARILRGGGVFAAYDCDWSQTLNAEAEQAYIACRAKAQALERSLRPAPEVQDLPGDAGRASCAISRPAGSGQLASLSRPVFPRAAYAVRALMPLVQGPYS